MHCYICDRQLSEKEINYNEEIQTYEPCTVCLDVIFDTAYCGGFSPDPDDYQSIDLEFDDVPIDSYIKIPYEEGFGSHAKDW